MDGMEELRRRWQERAATALREGGQFALGYYCCPAQAARGTLVACPDHPLVDAGQVALNALRAHGLSEAILPCDVLWGEDVSSAADVRALVAA